MKRYEKMSLVGHAPRLSSHNDRAERWEAEACGCLASKRQGHDLPVTPLDDLLKVLRNMSYMSDV